MADQVEEVKSRTDIVSVIGERIELKKAGRNYKALCPFHGERTPSFMVSPELQIFKCFGCGEAGDVFAFLEKYEGMEFGEALKYLADRAGIKLQSFNRGASSEKERLLEINSQALRFYNYLLLNHPIGKKALDYLLKDRGLKKQTIEEFQLGYSPEKQGVLAKFLIGKKKFNSRDLERTGLAVVRGPSIFDRFAGRVIFPLFDHRGNPIGFAGRVLPWDRRETGKYINSPDTPVYHKSAVLYGLNLTRSFIKKKRIAIVVEGELDAISSYQAGIKNIVAIKGSALTEEQVKLLSRFAQKFILALDSDFAGDLAARRGISVATNAGVEVKVAEIKGYKDPDEAARGNIQNYKKSLIESVGVWDFLIDSTFKKYGSGSGADKAKISKELVPILAEIGDKIVQAHYSGVVAKLLGVPIEAVSDEIGKIEGKAPSLEIGSLSKPDKKDRRTLLEERLLTLAFQSDPGILLEKGVYELVVTPLNKRILEEYKKFASKNRAFNPTDFSEKLSAELFDGFAALVLRDNENIVEDPETLKKEIDLIEKELRILIVRQNLKNLTTEIKELEEKGEKKGLLIAQNKFNKLASALSKLEHQEDTSIIFSE